MDQARLMPKLKLCKTVTKGDKSPKPSVKKLTPRQEVFVKEYLVDLNAKNAATKAGYSKKTANAQGCQLLDNPKVKAQIDKEMGKRAARVEISQDYVLQSIKDTIEAARQTGKDHGSVLKGLELLGKHLAMWTDKKEVKSTVEHLTSGDLSRDDLLKIAAGAESV